MRSFIRSRRDRSRNVLNQACAAAIAEHLEPRRLLAAGDFDPTFSGDGRLTLSLGARGAVLDVVTQSDGRVVVAGQADSASGNGSDAVLVRFDVDGSLDTSFGSGGVARIDFGFNERFNQLIVMADGKLVAGGQQTDARWMLARFTINGARDVGSSFGGTDGVQVGDGLIHEVARQGNNILTASSGLATGVNLVRRHVGSTGAIDTTFGNGGSVVISSAIAELPNFQFLDDLVVQNDGKVVVAGHSAGREGDPEEQGGDPLDYADRVMAVGRLTVNGAADGTFGTGGGVRKGLDNEGTSASAVGIRVSDGTMFVAGTDGGPDANLVRISSSGTITGFESLPSVSNDVMSSRAVLIDGAGRIIVAGVLDNVNTDTSDFMVTRFNADFTRDLSFGDGGQRYVEFGPATNAAVESLGGATLDPQGRIVLGGTSAIDAGPRLAVARVLSAEGGPTPDPTAPTIAISGGLLVARGTGGDDTFTVRRTGSDDVIVQVNGLSRQFDMDNFTGVRLEGFGGDDTFNLIDPLVSPVVRNTTVLGGTGSDTTSYATRTAALTFGVQPVASRMTSGAQSDVLDRVETIIGGSGADTFNYGDNEMLPPEEDVSPLFFRLEGRGGADRFVSSLVAGHVDGVTVFGGDGADHFEQGDLGARIFGEGGNDTVLLRGAPEFPGWVDGGAGTDLIIWGSGVTRLVLDLRDYTSVENGRLGGSRPGRTIIGTEGPNHIDASASTDPVTIHSSGGNDTLLGGSAADSLFGADGDDTLVGNAGNDTLNGGNGNDFADGGPGMNTHIDMERFAGGGGTDPTTPSIAISNRVLTARGTGNGDTITIERTGTDDVIVKVGSLSRQFDMDDFDGVLLEGLGGNDVITVKHPVVAGSLSRKVTIEGGAGNDSVTGSGGDEVLRGGDGSDTLVGLAGADALFGQNGNDFLFGGAGADFMDGGDNDDLLDASDSAGGDTVLGGNGNDSAEVDPGDDVSNVETIT